MPVIIIPSPDPASTRPAQDPQWLAERTSHASLRRAASLGQRRAAPTDGAGFTPASAGLRTYVRRHAPARTRTHGEAATFGTFFRPER